MKKIFLLAASFIFSIGAIYAGEEKNITMNELPVKAQEFIQTHWNNVGVTHIKMEKEFSKTEYEVILANKTKIEFNKNGDWKDIENKETTIPMNVLMQPTITYIQNNYPGLGIREISKEHNHYEVKLENDLELKFDLKGNFIKIDR